MCLCVCCSSVLSPCVPCPQRHISMPPSGLSCLMKLSLPFPFLSSHLTTFHLVRRLSWNERRIFREYLSTRILLYLLSSVWNSNSRDHLLVHHERGMVTFWWMMKDDPILLALTCIYYTQHVIPKRFKWLLSSHLKTFRLLMKRGIWNNLVHWIFIPLDWVSGIFKCFPFKTHIAVLTWSEKWACRMQCRTPENTKFHRDPDPPCEKGCWPISTVVPTSDRLVGRAWKIALKSFPVWVWMCVCVPERKRESGTGWFI